MWCRKLVAGILLFELCSAALLTGGHELDDYNVQEHSQVNSNPGKSTHGNRVFNRAVRGPLGNAALKPNQQKPQAVPLKAVTTSTQPTEVEKDEEANGLSSRPESDDEEQYQNKEEQSSTVNTTTAEPRKPFNGVVRPFRSNKDLLDSLKRRRQMQQSQGYTVVPQTSSTSTEKAQTKSFQNNRKNGNLNNKSLSAPVPEQKKTAPSRRYNSKTVPTTAAPVISNEAIAEETNIATQSTRTRTFTKPRRTT